MKDGVKTVTTERWGGGKGEPWVPPNSIILLGKNTNNFWNRH
jgi:hypothetical protein